MTKYLFKRLLYGLFSAVAVVAIVMVMIYSVMDRNLVFANDGAYVKVSNNSKIVYKYQKWEEFGYLDYVSYADWLNMRIANGEITEADKEVIGTIGRTADKDSKKVAEAVEEFKQYYKSQGYEVERLDAVMMGAM